MEANPRAVVAAAAALALVAAVVPAGAHDFGGGHPPEHCDPIGGDENANAATRKTYDRARLRTVGYADDGSVGGIPLEDFTRPAVEAADGADDDVDVPRVFGESDDGNVKRDIHVAATPIKLHFPGVLNNFLGNDLPGDVPKAWVEQGAYPPILGDRTFDGAMRIDGVFTGRIVVYEAKTDECQSNDADADIITLEGWKVRLEGHATAATGLDDGVQEPFGDAANLKIRPGSTEEL